MSHGKHLSFVLCYQQAQNNFIDDRCYQFHPPSPEFETRFSNFASRTIEFLGKAWSVKLGGRSITVNTVSPDPTAIDQLANAGADEKALRLTLRSIE